MGEEREREREREMKMLDISIVFFRFQETFSSETLEHEDIKQEQFLLFPRCFLQVLRIFCHFHKILNCRLQQILSIWKSLNFVAWERVKAFCRWLGEKICL